ncbi:hypothetical protein [[Kitasatospora] papulosa]|uniref:hypothetical protein n=1 Tax=[Kitasatospora] papulosa TaxID=1464011 RepID=UPI00362B69B0
MTDDDRLRHLLDRARRGVILPAEGEALAVLVGEREAAIEQAELDAEQQARHFRTICGERESYRQAWKYEQKHRATAEARVRELETASAPEVDRRPLHARHVTALTTAYPDLRHTADHIANLILGVRDEHVRELEQRVAELTAGQCTHALAVCEKHHRVPVTGCPYPRCKAAAARTTA